jgi:hypothetical protein
MASAEDGAEYSPRVPVDQSDTGHGLGNSSTPRLSEALDLEDQRESANRFRRRADLIQDTMEHEPVHVGCSLELKPSLSLIIEAESNKERRGVYNQCATLTQIVLGY